MHDHLQSAMPSGSFPVFWCENCETTAGSIILHYYSTRGALLSGVVVGITKEVAKTYFDVEVTMIKLATQDVDGSQCTTWRITSVDPKLKYKLTDEHLGSDDHSIVQQSINRRKARRPTLQHGNRTGGGSSNAGGSSHSGSVSFDPFYLPIDSPTSSASKKCPFSSTSLQEAREEITSLKCPFSSSFNSSESPGENDTTTRQQEEELKSKLISRHESIENLVKYAEEKKRNEISHRRKSDDIPVGSSGTTGGERRLSASKKRHHSSSSNTRRRSSTDKKVNGTYGVPSEYEHGLTASRVRKIFPYHVVSGDGTRVVMEGEYTFISSCEQNAYK